MIQSINPFLTFAGDASSAIALYESAVGAKICALMRWADMPGQDFPPEIAQRVMYARLDIGGGAIELSDAPPDMAAGCFSADAPTAAGGGAFVAVHIDDPAALDRAVAALAEGGTVEMGPEDTFWGARYAKLRDRFGVGWTFHCQLGDPGLHTQG